MNEPKQQAPRRIVYLDNEILNSCNSQLVGGVENSSTTSLTTSSSLGGMADINIATSAEGGIGVPIAKLSATSDISTELSANLDNCNSSNRSVTMCPYDNVHNALIEKLAKGDLIRTELNDANIGDIVNISGSITIISKEMLSKFANNDTVLRRILNVKEPEQNQSTLGAETLADMLKLLDIMIPYDVFAKVDNSIVVLRKDSFRTGPTISPHMFGGDATVFGYVTNIICSTCINEDNVFSQFISQINASLCQILGCQEMRVICPISIYYQ